MTKQKVFIVDDHKMFREGLVFAFSKSDKYEIVQQAEDGLDFLSKFEEYNDVAIVLMDISMPNMNGIEATKRCLEINPKVKILALSMFGDEEYYYKMIHAGVKGFVLKEAGSKELEQAMDELIKGENFFSQKLLQNVIFTKEEKEKRKNELDFTEREMEVLELTCRGYSNKEIADKLCLSSRTIESHKSNLYSKTNVNNTVNLVMFAIKNDIIKVK
ncbi:MAG: response regulator transcription factor [Bacteroidales bacterium]|nr:response regulator transcription factor [Bacteroidales bacterium]